MLIQQKYRVLFSPKRVCRPGPKGPTKELIDAVVEMKGRNCTWGCKRIAEQIALAFGVDIDKDVVRRILATQFHPEAGSGGPSWLSFIGNAKRLAVVVGFVSMRVCNIANVLGFGRDGSIYTTNRRLRRSPRRGGWSCAVPDVQSSHSNAEIAEISEFGPRSAVSVPSVGGEPPCPHGPTNQNGALRSSFASFRGKTHRDFCCPQQNAERF